MAPPRPAVSKSPETLPLKELSLMDNAFAFRLLNNAPPEPLVVTLPLKGERVMVMLPW